MTISNEHQTLLKSQAISDHYIEAVCETVPAGLAFNFTGTTGQSATQVRLDCPELGKGKYVGPAGVPSVMPVPPGHEALVGDSSVPLLIVEGSKGVLAAASALEGTTQPRLAVVGVLGCWGWSSGGSPTEDLMALPCDGRDVTILFDADMSANRSVWEAASGLSEQLKVVLNARSVKFGRMPGNAKAGLDDALAPVAKERRQGVLRRIVEGATDKLGRSPARSRDHSGPFGEEGYSADVAARVLVERNTLAMGRDKSVTVYQRGVYLNGDSREFNRLVTDLLGKDYTKIRYRDVEDTTLTLLVTNGKKIPEFQDRRLIPFRNGLLDPLTLRLHPHDPTFRTMRQFNVDWGEDATCPKYEEWMSKQLLPGTVEDLEEVVSQMFDLTRTPVKGALLYGPSRSGKGTFLRLVEGMAGREHTSAVSMQALAQNRFAPADMYGKTLNVSADLSAREVSELSVLKMAMGDDYIRAERKNGQPFQFRNTAVMMFAANAIPPVSEASQAYFTRIKPFYFGASYAGREDPKVLEGLLDELPGIAVKWVFALNRRLARGAFLETHSETDQHFRSQSDQVVRFVGENCLVGGGRFTKRSLVYERFKTWHDGSRMTRSTLYERLLNVDGVSEERGGPSRERGFNVTLVDPDAGGSGTTGNSGPLLPCTYSSSSSSQSSQEQGDNGLPALPASPVPDQIPLVLDLETAAAGRLHSYGPGFVRLAGSSDGIVEVSDIPDSQRPLIAHNGFNFDFVALNKYHDFDYLTASEAGLLRDSKILAILADPPTKGRKPPAGTYYGLDAAAQRHAGIGKTDEIKALVKTYGGFDRIPVDSQEYRDYCLGDVRATEALVAALPETVSPEYATREMRAMGRLTYASRCIGWRVDTALLQQRLNTGQKVTDAGLDALRDFGLPETNDNGVPYKKPQSTKAGRAAIVAALKAVRVTKFPTTSTGAIAIGKDAWDGYDIPEKARPLMDAVWSLNGVRSVYGTVDAYRTGDRVYPSVMPYQSSGRFSIQEPGLTVMGKRGGRHIEREIFLPEPGEQLVSFDLNQIDARAIAMHSQDADYMALFRDPGIDAHEEIAYRLWGVRDGSDGPFRNRAKAISHGWNYGEGLTRLSGDTGLDMGVVKAFDQGMRASFPRLVEWLQEVREEAASGALLDNGFGRKMRPDPKRAHTQGPALMGQGLARDLFVEGILRLPIQIVPMIRGAVHDELVLSVPVGIMEDVKRDVLKALQFEHLGVPVTAGCEGVGHNWGEIYRS